MRIASALGLLVALAFPGATSAQDGAAPAYRTDAANPGAAWYQPRPLEFPPRDSAHAIAGTLVAADFIHRSGTFRAADGTLMDFAMPPYGTAAYAGAEAELRDVPLGTNCVFHLHQDASGAFTRLAAVEDDFSAAAAAQAVWRLDAVHDGALAVTARRAGADAGSATVAVDAATRVWKGEGRATLADLEPGDELRCDFRDDPAQQPRHCCDVWAGADAQARATAAQRERHKAFLVARGLPAWIERVDGKKLTISLFSRDQATLHALLADAGVVPATWVKDHRWIAVVVADHELRTYNPPVDKQHGPILELLPPPTDGYGCGGERWVFEPRVLLEGFRPGRLLRVFAHDSWKFADMPYGEGLYEHGFETNDDDPGLFPYRTDLYNADLPWFAAKPTSFPPDQSAHRVGGELIRVDAAHRAGRFRGDRGGAEVDFTMPPYGTVLRCGAEGELTDLPLGTHCWFDLHQDGSGAFTRAAVVLDDASRLAQDTVTYRVEEAAADGRLRVARQIPPIKDYQDQMITPPDLGRCELPVDAHTRVWKGGKDSTVAELAPGDVLLADRGAVSASSPGTCTEIWAGADTIAAAAEHQRQQHRALVKAQGMPGLITAIDGRKLTVVFFAGVRADFPPLIEGDPWGKPVFVATCDDLLKPEGAFVRMGFANHLPESATAGTYGCSGIRWVVECEHPDAYHVGQVLRVLKEGWPLPAGQESAH